MIIPTYWAESRLQRVENRRQVTVRRWGWSDIDQSTAQAHAETRASEALEAIWKGSSNVDRRERKVPYNGAEGVPIREEIIARFGETVITRNSYGALCLNTPNVLFIDVDHFESVPWVWVLRTYLLFVLLAIIFAWFGAFANALGAIVLGFVFMHPLASLVWRNYLRWVGGQEAKGLSRVKRFIDQHQDWNLRAYRTPAGLRLLATHRLFDPNSEEVLDAFQALGADAVYERMCQRQKCFRARLTPKPWRMCIDQHMPPRAGVWPIAPEHRESRRFWVSQYEERATSYAACARIGDFGSGSINPLVNEVMMIHDRLSKADSALPIA